MPYCLGCGNEVRVDDNFCPRCGRNVRQALVSIIKPPVSPNEPTPHGLSQPSGVVSTTQIVNDYVGNEAAADTKYRDKVIRISGKVTGGVFRDESTGKYYTALEASPLLVVVYFKGSEQAKVAQVEIGQSITVSGKCQGLRTTVGGNMVVGLLDGQLLQ